MIGGEKLSKKHLILVILAVLLVQDILGVVCDDTPENKQLCQFVTPPLSCTDYNYTIYDSNKTINETGTLSIYSDNLYYFNFSKNNGDYLISLCDGTFREVYVGGDPMSNVAFIGGLLGTVFALLFFAFKLNDEHSFIKTLLGILGVFLLSIIPYFLLETYADVSSSLFYQIYIIFIWIFVAYIFLYFAWNLFIYLGNAWNKNKRFNMK